MNLETVPIQAMRDAVSGAVNLMRCGTVRAEMRAAQTASELASVNLEHARAAVSLADVQNRGWLSDAECDAIRKGDFAALCRLLGRCEVSP